MVVPGEAGAPTIAVPRKGTARRPRIVLDGAAVRVVLAVRPVVPIETKAATIVVRGAEAPLSVDISVQGDVRVHPSRSYTRAPESVRVGEPFDCEVVITNDGSRTLRDGVVRLRCGEGFRVTGAPEQAWHELEGEQRVLAWPVQQLNVGERVAWRIVAVLEGLAPHANASVDLVVEEQRWTLGELAVPVERTGSLDVKATLGDTRTYRYGEVVDLFVSVVNTSLEAHTGVNVRVESVRIVQWDAPVRIIGRLEPGCSSIVRFSGLVCAHVVGERVEQVRVVTASSAFDEDCEVAVRIVGAARIVAIGSLVQRAVLVIENRGDGVASDVGVTVVAGAGPVERDGAVVGAVGQTHRVGCDRAARPCRAGMGRTVRPSDRGVAGTAYGSQRAARTGAGDGCVRRVSARGRRSELRTKRVVLWDARRRSDGVGSVVSQ